MKRSRLPAICFILLLALGLGMRTFGAWVYEFAHTSDHGIICLMVKHMLEGKEFPVFFYGLPYMGSIEPAVSALLCAVFGLNGFWINMGTALTAFAFLPLVFIWGRGAAGWVGGLAALAFCAIGPPQYFQFESWADGGYAAIPLFTCAVLLMSLRILEKESACLEPGRPRSNLDLQTENAKLEPGRPRPGLNGAEDQAGAKLGRGRPGSSHWNYLVLGIIAGLGWWQSPLLIPAFLVSGFLFLVVMGKRLFTTRLFSGAGGFVIGSLPLWIWNLRNHWQTFDMVKTHDSPSLWQGLKLFYLTRLPDLLELQRQPMLVRTALAILLLILAGLALARFASAWRAKARGEVLYMAAAILFLIVFSILFGRSRFSRVNALRYVLILIPVLGVLIGVATAWLVQRTRWGVGWLPVMALVALQVSDLPDRFGERERSAAFIPKAMKLGEFLRANNIKHLYTDYQVRGANHGLNYLLNEEFVFSPVTRERYRPYARAMEQSENPAVLNDTAGFSAFLKMTGATCESNVVEGMLVQYNVKPPTEAWRVIDPLSGANSFKETEPGKWELCTYFNNIWTEATRVNSPFSMHGMPSGTVHSVTLDFCGVRLLCEPDAYPASVAVDVWDETAKSWTNVLSETPVTRYFWSGTRFYWGNDSYRLECRFKPVRSSGVRIRMKSSQTDAPRVRSVEPMIPDPAQVPPGEQDLKSLAELMRSKGLKRIYTDRWEANKLINSTGPDVHFSLPRHLYDRESLSPEMEINRQTAIVVRNQYGFVALPGISRIDSVGSHGYACTNAGPWSVYIFSDPVLPHVAKPCLFWVGCAALPVNDRVWALQALKTLQGAIASGEIEKNPFAFASLVRDAISLLPDHRPLIKAYAACRLAEGTGDNAEDILQEAEQAWTPNIPINVAFHGGIELLGVKTNLSSSPIEMKYLWRFPSKARKDLRVFVHFKRDGKILFQDDRDLPMDLAEGFQPDDVVVETRNVKIPKDVSPGPVQIEMGLYRSGDGGRVKFKGKHQSGKTIILPVPLNLLQEQDPVRRSARATSTEP
jgi:hypothetical protein